MKISYLLPVPATKLLALVLLLAVSSSVFATNWTKPAEIEDAYARQVEIIENADGRLSVFSVEMDKQVVYRTQTAPNSNEWGKRIALGIYANQIKLTSHADGRIDVFAIGLLGNVITHITQRAPNEDAWGKETEIKGTYAQQVELITNEDDAIVVFFVEMDKELSYIKETAPNSNEWTEVRSLDTYGTQIAVGSNSDGKIELFNIGTLGNVLYRISQLEPNGDKWTKEQQIKGLYGRQIETAINLDGTLGLFIVEMDKEIVYIKQTSPGSSKWTGAESLETYGNLIEVNNNGAGAIEIVIVGTMGSALTQMSQTVPADNQWTKEKDMKGYALQMRLRENADGSLQLVYIAPFANQMWTVQEKAQ